MKKPKKPKVSFASMHGRGCVLTDDQAREIGPVLVRIEQKNGAIKPATVVQEASSPSSPLHSYFTWDDTEAAKKCRLEEARSIIRSVRIIHEDAPDIVVHAFTSVKATSKESKFSGYGYLSTPAALNKKEYKEQVLNTALSEIEVWKRRYSGLVELASICGAIEATIKKLKRV